MLTAQYVQVKMRTYEHIPTHTTKKDDTLLMLVLLHQRKA